MSAILTLAAKDLRLLLRDRAGLFWVLAFPLVMALFFGSMFGGPGDDDGDRPRAIRVAVVDDDGSEASADVVARLRGTKALAVETLAREAAWRAVQEGDVAAFIALPRGFGDAVGKFGTDAPQIEIATDPSRRAEAGMLQGIVIQTVVRRVFSTPGGDADAAAEAWSPVRVKTREVAGRSPFSEGRAPKSGFEIAFPSSMLWAVLACAATFAISIVQEREAGTWLRLTVAPIARRDILLGKGLACFAACLVVTVLLFAFGVAVFGIRVQNPAGAALAVVCVAVAFTGLMSLLSTLGRTERAVSGAGWGVATVLAMLGGGMMPLAFMPGWLQTASHVSPVKWGILALEGSIWRGFDAAQMLVPCAILAGFEVVAFAVGARVISRREG